MNNPQTDLEQLVATAPLHRALYAAVHELRTVLNDPLTRCRGIALSRPELSQEMEALYDSIGRVSKLMRIYFDDILYTRLHALAEAEDNQDNDDFEPSRPKHDG